jgi:hypothetical protein
MKKQISYILILLVLMVLPATAQQQSADAYRLTLRNRSEKIIRALGITDSAQFNRVTEMLTDQYVELGRINDIADSTLKTLKTNGLSKEDLTLRQKAVENERNARLYQLHTAFIAKLEGELTPDQVEGVKNGMTYNVLNVTYKAHLEMIPTLKEDEKRQIMIWLIEAREHAMDASSSDKKHAWFGKYKGRINNYLAARGYDLQQERTAWQERLKQQKDN